VYLKLEVDDCGTTSKELTHLKRYPIISYGDVEVIDDFDQ